jgi:hypothetical protein
MLTFAKIDRKVLEDKREHIVQKFRELSRKDRAFIDAIIQATRDKKRINTRLERWILSLREIGIECPDIKCGD